ncbi:hypothetical protein PAXRUDRAFT_836317 [Paxillus rubicundulus Ve08.2h10]|uniref:Uncharacterized protein n=1 Tax=Paxillus rubicundulus Ve08.2h10 TaxID=930991 RepID=A0A0D0D7V5_9AGAM|nr:hypothetical protein PAXRUDRAFT_836317 [Paxillus rubicundulus Ve08.2h10]
MSDENPPTDPVWALTVHNSILMSSDIRLVWACTGDFHQLGDSPSPPFSRRVSPLRYFRTEQSSSINLNDPPYQT